MDKHAMNGKMESPIRKKKVSFAVIQIFSLKALKTSSESLALSF